MSAAMPIRARLAASSCAGWSASLLLDLLPRPQLTINAGGQINHANSAVQTATVESCQTSTMNAATTERVLINVAPETSRNTFVIPNSRSPYIGHPRCEEGVTSTAAIKT